jgi:hypothetical protein
MGSASAVPNAALARSNVWNPGDKANRKLWLPIKLSSPLLATDFWSLVKTLVTSSKSRARHRFARQLPEQTVCRPSRGRSGHTGQREPTRDGGVAVRTPSRWLAGLWWALVWALAADLPERAQNSGDGPAVRQAQPLLTQFALRAARP